MLERSALKLSDISVRRGGRLILDRIDLDLPSSGLTAILGPNGAGKSVLLRVMAGLIAPDSGTMTLNTDATALVFQKPVLLRRSVRANLDHALRIYGLDRDARRHRQPELLRLARLDHLADQPARVLSGGEQQRLAMVRAIAAAPDILLLDEPAASLDPRATHLLEVLIDDVVRSGVKVVLVTHDREQARRLADHACLLHNGRIVESGSADDVFDHPQSPLTRDFLAGTLLLDGK